MIFGGLDGSNFVSIFSVLWFFFHLVQLTGKHAQLRQKYIFVIAPLANPDGFQHVVDSGDATWEKSYCQLSGCENVNLNRNFDSEFGIYRSPTSWDPSDREYPGRLAFSASETKHIRDHIGPLDETGRLLLVLNVFGTGKTWTVPFGSGRRPNNYHSMLQMARGAVANIQQYHPNRQGWRYGNTATIENSKRSGSLEDYIIDATLAAGAFSVSLAPGDGPTSKQSDWRGYMESGMDLFNGIVGATDVIDSIATRQILYVESPYHSNY